MKEFVEFVDDLIEGRSYRLGEPWKYSSKSAGVIIPVLRDESFERDYVTLPEVKDDVEVEDTGVIEDLKIRNKSGKIVFVRAGTVFEGKGTQSRVAEHNTIILAEGKIGVKCVHQSHPVRYKASFEYFGLAPKPVTSRLISGDQVGVWSGVKAYACTMLSRPSMASRTPVTVTDSLVEVKRAVKKLDSKMKEVLEKVPAFENQVGAIIVSVNGIEGIEVFDHPESWRAHYKEVIENYECVAEDMPPLFTIDESAVMEHVVSFLKELKNAVADKVNEHTWLLRHKDYVGEFTVYNGRVIHMFAVKHDVSVTTNNVTYTLTVTGSNDLEPISTSWTDELVSTSEYDIQMSVKDVFRKQVESKKGLKDVLMSVGNGKTWSEIWAEIRPKSKMSTATLSKRLKNGKDMGLISVDYRNGKKVYKLTDLGKTLLATL